MQWIKKLKKKRKRFVYWKVPFQCSALTYHPSWNRLDISFLIFPKVSSDGFSVTQVIVVQLVWRQAFGMSALSSLLQMREIRLETLKYTFYWSVWELTAVLLSGGLECVLGCLKASACYCHYTQAEATAVWDWRAMVSTSEHGTLPGRVSRRAKHQAGLQRLLYQRLGDPRHCLRRKPGKVKKASPSHTPGKRALHYRHHLFPFSLSVFIGIKKLNAGGNVPQIDWFHNWKIFPERAGNSRE